MFRRKKNVTSDNMSLLTILTNAEDSAREINTNTKDGWELTGQIPYKASSGAFLICLIFGRAKAA